MIEITTWMNKFLQTLNRNFGDRVWFVGLQGSYGRGEATETSDIDIVVILDELSALDIQTYNRMLDTLSHRELICGFLSGKKEILNWEPSDLFQFYYDTKPIKGSLDELLLLIDDDAVHAIELQLVQAPIERTVERLHHALLHFAHVLNKTRGITEYLQVALLRLKYL